MCDDVTQVCVHKLQKLEDDYFGKRALQSGKLLRAQTPKRKLLPETGLIGPVQNLGVCQIFTFPSDTEMLCDFGPKILNGTFDSSVMYNQLDLDSWLSNF
jgi:hypothetical protein